MTKDIGTRKIDFNAYWDRIDSAEAYQILGKITQSVGLLYEAYLPGASVGSVCSIQGEFLVEAEVVGFRDKKVMLMPFQDVKGIGNGSLVRLIEGSPTIPISTALVGRVLDARGQPLDEKGPIEWGEHPELRNLYEKPTHPLKRSLITEPLDLGVRSINGLLSCGKGQRVGIMAGSGVGKSVLLGMMARNTAADINVIALIGERGREVREFIERDLGPEGLARSIVVVATSDASPLMRMRGAFLAATLAEYFRDQGSDVLLMMDSVTRFCMAQREIGLSLGEPPASKGYTPSVFATLPKLLERAGTSPTQGSITGLFTVLVEGDDLDDPVADSARSILDGHIVLSRKLAERSHFPAVDVLQSTSRVMNQVISTEHRKWAAQVREWLALYAQIEDLINIGAYVRGANPRVDVAVAMIDRINGFLRQDIAESMTFEETMRALQSIFLAGEAFFASQAAQRSQNQALGQAIPR